MVDMWATIEPYIEVEFFFSANIELVRELVHSNKQNKFLPGEPGQFYLWPGIGQGS